MKDDNCIFCKLANGDIPTNTIYEDADFRVILDASPATKGHALILPKQHFKDLCELDPAISAKALPLDVFHFHMHLIPRKAGDQAVPEWEHLSLSDDEMKEICDKMKM